MSILVLAAETFPGGWDAINSARDDDEEINTLHYTALRARGKMLDLGRKLVCNLRERRFELEVYDMIGQDWSCDWFHFSQGLLALSFDDEPMVVFDSAGEADAFIRWADYTSTTTRIC